MKATSKKERIAYFQKLVDGKQTLQEIYRDKEVRSWQLAGATIERYALECGYDKKVEEEPELVPESEQKPEQPEEIIASPKEADAINSEMDSDIQTPMPKPAKIKLPVYDAYNETVELDRVIRLIETIEKHYSALIRLRLQAKKGTTALIGFRKRIHDHGRIVEKYQKRLQKDQARR